MTNQGKLAGFFAILAVFCFLSSRPYELIAAPQPPQYPVSRPTMPPMPTLPSGIPKMALEHLAKARKWQSDAILVAIRVRNYFMVPGSIPQHGVYGVYLTYLSPKSGGFQDYAVGPSGEDVLLRGMPPGAVVVNPADIHPNAVRGDPDVWLENLFSEYMRKIAAQNEANSSGPSNSGPGFPSRATALCGSVGSEYSSCLDGGRLTNFRTYREAQSASKGSPED